MNKKKSLFIFTGILVFSVLIIALITALGSGGGYKILASGLQYKIILNKAKTKATEGQLMIAYLTYKTEKDSIVFSTYTTEKKTTTFPVGKPENIADLNEAFLLLGPNDSAIIRLPADSIFKGNANRPAFAGKGSFIHVGIKVDTVMNKESFEQLTLMKSTQQKEIDDELIKKYLKENNLKATRTETGLYYIINKSGTGQNPTDGQSVSVLYTGKLIDGKIFDSSQMSGGEPITVKLGARSVIAGWEQGLKYFNRGAKGLLLLPSNLAYGDREFPDRIPANSVLVFEVEITSIK